MFRSLCLALLILTLAPVNAAPTLSDPTRPYVQRESSQTKARRSRSLDLQSTLFSEGRALARINGQLLAQGDQIRGYRLEEIGIDYVRLRKGTEEKVIRLLRKRVKRPATSARETW